MKLTITSSGIRVGDELRAYVARRLAFAFGRFGPLLRHVAVRLTDLNGPRGGVDKACALAVTLEPANVVRVTQRNRSVQSAVDVAVERAAVAVARELGRRRDLRRSIWRRRPLPLAGD